MTKQRGDVYRSMFEQAASLRDQSPEQFRPSVYHAEHRHELEAARAYRGPIRNAKQLTIPEVSSSCKSSASKNGENSTKS